MRAVILEKIGGPENLSVQEVALPEPAPGEVRVKLLASALNRRDYWITQGLYPDMRLPCTTGSDGAGIVDKVGAGVDLSLLNTAVVLYPARNWGDNPLAYGPDFRVLGMPDQGTFAEFICVPVSGIQPRPRHLDWFQSAALPVAGLTAWRAVVTQAEVRPGQRVMITGAGGGVSAFAIQWCLAIGAEVYISSGNDDKIARALKIGVAGGVNYHKDNAYKELGKKLGGFDVIIDSAGGDTMNQLLATLKPAGRYVFYGATMRNPPSGLEMARLFFRHIRLQGTTMGTPDEFRDMLAFVEEHRLIPVVDRVLPLGQIIQAHRLMENYSQNGKIVIDNQL
jgi:zinc-binding alcohol dehydrogenase/oxidoreductase